jgi:hypothetical protein
MSDPACGAEAILDVWIRLTTLRASVREVLGTRPAIQIRAWSVEIGSKRDDEEDREHDHRSRDEQQRRHFVTARTRIRSVGYLPVP